ncbi:MAG: hypothetical protein IT372_31525 [Polyangiaceae bacterium]|nr:hypothetical protein [Polyangiaceae bacterium]
MCWQIVPGNFGTWMRDPDRDREERVADPMRMVRLDMVALGGATKGETA